MCPALLLVRGGIQFPMMMELMTLLASVDATVLLVKIIPSRMVTVQKLIRHTTKASV